MKQCKILIVDDHKLFREAYARLIKSLIDPPPFCEQASDGFEAIDMIHKYSYDLMFLDISMPNLNAIGLHKIIAGEKLALPTIILSQHDDLSLVNYFITHGVSGYLTKNVSTEELSQAFKTVVEGGTYIQTEIATRMESNSHVCLAGSVNLTSSEQKLIHFLSLGLTSKEISIRMGLTPKTIDTYRERLLDKTGTKNVAELVSFSFRLGLNCIYSHHLI